MRTHLLHCRPTQVYAPQTTTYNFNITSIFNAGGGSGYSCTNSSKSGFWQGFQWGLGNNLANAIGGFFGGMFGGFNIGGLFGSFMNGGYGLGSGLARLLFGNKNNNSSCCECTAGGRGGVSSTPSDSTSGSTSSSTPSTTPTTPKPKLIKPDGIPNDNCPDENIKNQMTKITKDALDFYIQNGKLDPGDIGIPNLKATIKDCKIHKAKNGTMLTVSYTYSGKTYYCQEKINKLPSTSNT